MAAIEYKPINSDQWTTTLTEGLTFREQCILALLDKVGDQAARMQADDFAAWIIKLADMLADTHRPE
jgi:hypothetical protein